ncbi:hypothetical protein SAMN06265182_0275 [Persephonella hydrogeniphila]|uniref:Uncharacterized protein n=1 Tax=Persephonella hydrogeniphila TaxID=198703 RepID=A0A285N129_9AQUI|nr:hypothetical protein [Persephonella hydrogeniphila]SNZ03038.1 hypothetical protein SAMN06265182_0275 [Persephonella hydrogeniphila]
MRFFILILSLVVLTPAFAQTLEERINRLEEKVKQLEERLNRIEGKTQKKEISSDLSDVILLDENQNLISYKVLSKKFKPMNLKETLWQRSDQIILKMVFKNNTGKEVKNITGKVVIYDKSGNKLMEKKININKALNFFKGMEIKPEEEVKMSVEFDYDKHKEEHRKVKELPLDQLVIKFYPLKIEFSDGTTKYIKYKR